MSTRPLYVTEKNLKTKARAWQKAIAPHNRHKMTLNARKTALLVIDMQHFFLDPDGAGFTAGGPAIIPNVSRILQEFRRCRRPVIYTAHVHDPQGSDAGILGWWWDEACLEGTAEAQIHPVLAPLPGEKVVYKHRYSAFFGTDLDIVLRCLGIQDLVITGVMTNLCCESTARDAYFRDYRVFFVLDGTGSVNEEFHLGSLRNLAYGFAYVTTTREVLRMMGGR